MQENSKRSETEDRGQRRMGENRKRGKEERKGSESCTKWEKKQQDDRERKDLKGSKRELKREERKKICM